MTPREQRVLDVVRDAIAANGIAPSLDEIAAAIGLAGKGGIQEAIGALARDGHLIRHAGRRRGLSLPDVPNLVPVPTKMIRAELARRGEVA